MSHSVEPQVAQFNIGELLSSKRHQLHESIADVSNKIKLSKSVVEKLEANQFDEIGTAVYVRGYLGLYAKHLELNGSTIIEQYNNQYPTEEVTIRPSAGQGLGESRQKSKRHSKTLSLLMVAMVMGGLAFAYLQAESYWQQTTTEQTADNGNVHAGQTTTGMTTVLDEATAAQNLADDVLSGDSIATANDSLVTNIELDVALADTDKPDESLNVTASSSESADVPKVEIQLESIGLKNPNDTESTSDNEVTETAQTETPSVNSEALASGMSTISMAFNGECWIKITDANKKVIAAKLYKAGERLKVSGSGPLLVSAGAPFAISSVKLNDASIDLSSYKISGFRYRLPKQ